MKNNQILAVSLGFPVTVSSYHENHDCNIARLDVQNYAWSPQINDLAQWIQVSSLKPQLWVAVITQGRPNWDQWMQQYRVQYSIDGNIWYYVDQGRIFIGNNDRNTKVRNDFKKSVLARTIRILPTKWYQHITTRFQAIFIQS